ncbi:MAG: glycosyltransferase family 4 protein [Blastocatellales bacterium]|nr:glycosyltransferase family 4 protein [Blastocatellales bacterium]
MRILYITAGAAGMYCGSCLRDNALAAELMARGHDVMLLPLYTPTRTDEQNVSSERVFFGGISVYLQQHSAVFRHTPRLLDRLWDSRVALRAASRRSIAVDPGSLSEMTLSMLRGEQGRQSKELFKLLDFLGAQSPPDIVNLPNALLIALAGPIRRKLGRPVCVTLQGEDLFLKGMPEDARTEAVQLIRRHAASVDGFISVSEFYADSMAELLGVLREKIFVVPLGINPEGYDNPDDNRRDNGNDRFTVGYLARIAPEKGLHVLAEAYRDLRTRGELAGARLEVAGYMAPEHRSYFNEIGEKMNSAGLGEEFNYRGELNREEKIRFLQSLDVFSMPTTYEEPKGMSVIEAMASGAPVVQPRWGSFPEMIERTNGGILVEPDDATSLAEGLSSLWKNPERARNLGRQGAIGVRRHYTAANMSERALEVYADIQRAFIAGRNEDAGNSRFSSKER